MSLCWPCTECILNTRYPNGYVWKCWVNIPNEIAIFHRDNDQQNHWVFRGTQHFQTNPNVSSNGKSLQVWIHLRHCVFSILSRLARATMLWRWWVERNPPIVLGMVLWVMLLLLLSLLSFLLILTIYYIWFSIFVAFVISTIISIVITIMFTTVLHILNPCCFKDYNLSTASSKKSLEKRGRIEAVSEKVVVSW